MNIDELQMYIEEHIPLVKKAGLKITHLSEQQVTVSGELPDNKNHHNTVFGGSISVTLTVAGWLLIREIMEKEDPESSIVISNQNVEYLKPVLGDFEGTALSPDSAILEDFKKTYRRRGTGKLEIEALFYEKGKNTPCARFTGMFFIRKKPAI